MRAFTKLTGRILVLEQENIDTDQIIPARFLTATDFNGIGDHAFADWRTDDNGEPLADHVLNQPQAHDSPILVGGHNFGCGSSREHAPHALLGFGFRVQRSRYFLFDSVVRQYVDDPHGFGLSLPVNATTGLNVVGEIKI